MRIAFGPFVLDTDTRELTRDGEALHLTPKALRLLEILIEERPRAVAKEALIERLWPEQFIFGGEPERAREAAGAAYPLARIHALRGEPDEAFRWLDEAIDLGWNVAAITAMDPVLESLRDDSRFEAALDRMERSLAPMRERVASDGR